MLTIPHMRQGASVLLRLILSFIALRKVLRHSTPRGDLLTIGLLRDIDCDACYDDAPSTFPLFLVFVLATRSSGMFGLHPTDAMTNLTTLDSCLLLNAAQGCVNGSRFDALHGGLFNLLGKNTSLLHA